MLPLEDAKAVEKIEETFHLTLLRDHMLRPTMEEANLTSLSSLIFFNRCACFKFIGVCECILS